ncbi:sugar phosphate isomerase/epimerase [Candidatus Sumerlaeota bacterium]|nr:sugar phosphate isomerase/epimerase [Candidatus Sumerlaeota bacterium]
MTEPLNDLSRLCIHTITTKNWNLEQAIEGYVQAGVPGVTVWRQWLDGIGAPRAGELLRTSGLDVVSLCRGGFYVADTEAGRSEAVDDNRRAIDEAAAIGAPLVVLVCGAQPGVPLLDARGMIRDGIEASLSHATQCGVKLAIEPLHPMYAADRSAINTIRQANDMAEAIGSPHCGVAVDVYHLWWDPELESEIRRCGEAGRLFAFHVCDWLSPTRDLLNDRGLMGDGCIPIRQIRGWVEATGFHGYNEVEIFSDELWRLDPADFTGKIKTAYLQHV